MSSRVLPMFALLSTAALESPAQSVLLRPKLEKGASRYIERKTELSQSVTGAPGGQEQKMLMKMTFGAIESVESASADGAKLKLTFDRAGMSSDAPMMGGEFDSDMRNDDESPELAAMFEPMLGESASFELDKDLNVGAFSGMKAIIAKLEKSGGGNMMLEQFKRRMSDEQYRAAWGIARYAPYSGKEVKVGDKWSRKTTNSIPNIGELLTEFEFEAVKPEPADGAGVVRIAYTAKITQKGESKPDERGMTVRFEKGSTKGTAIFDPKVGAIVSQSAVTEATLKAQIGAAGQEPMTMTIAQKSTEEIRSLSTQERAKQKEENKAKAGKKPAAKEGKG